MNIGRRKCKTSSHFDQLAEKDKTSQMVQHQHIPYTHNYNCSERYLQFTSLLIAIM